MNSNPLTLETLAVRVTALELESTRNKEAHEKIYSRVEELENGHAVTDSNLKNIENLCNEIRADVKELKEKPAKRYDGLVSAVMQWAIIGLLSASIIFK